MDQSVAVDFAGAIIRFDVETPSLKALVTRRYQRFLAGADGRARLGLRWRPEAGSEYAFHAGGAGHDPLLLSEPDTRHLDLTLRGLLPTVVDGAVFHAALLADGERGLLCCGEPGAGKSTIARLVGDRALCDEMAVVDRLLVARSLPYWSARPGTVSLSDVFVLAHGERHRRRLLTPGDAFRELSRHVYWPVDDDRAMHTALDAVGEVAARVPVWRLEFRPTPDVWSVLTEQEA